MGLVLYARIVRKARRRTIGTATRSVRRWLWFRAAGIRGVNGVSRQAPLASGGVLVL